MRSEKLKPYANYFYGEIMPKASWHQRIRRRPKEDRTIGGITFDSVGEAKYWVVLQALQRAGKISALERQPRYKLFCGDKPILYASGRHAEYTPDFQYIEDGKLVVVDYKGYDGDDAGKLRRAVFTAMTGNEVTLAGPGAKRRK